MSATLGLLASHVRPDWRITLVERLDDVGLESSQAWNNAGTGHAGLCEFNYTPRRPDGSVDITAAVSVNEQFHVTRQLWSALVAHGTLPEPASFIRPVPHMSVGFGDHGVDYLRQRHAALQEHPLMRGQRFSEDRQELAAWLPLMLAGRSPGEPMAVSRSEAGTDVDYGALTQHLVAALRRRGATVLTGHEATALRRRGDVWELSTRTDQVSAPTVTARLVFAGTGGGTLPLLRSARLPEVAGLGVFPLSGQFLRTSRPDLVQGHRAKVYGHAEPGAPPISVPHLDLRSVQGEESLLFGPFASFSPRFLQHGRRSDLPRSVHRGNARTLAMAALDHPDMVRHLLAELRRGAGGRLTALRRFVPEARPEDWELITAGQRVQLVRPSAGRATIVGFGTEVVTSADATLAGLLGASPGASTSASIMIDVLGRLVGPHAPSWRDRVRTLVPSLDTDLADDPALAASTTARTDEVLGLL